ncbi:ERCC4 domain-containing protein [Flavobacterium sp.]|jgi:ERCC4-type nuclease|uniref:ERCC4 domain-containing protein n=1 Tax=Flavobacterium sp. TaxID=239 RepID=UPI0037C15E31
MEIILDTRESALYNIICDRDLDIYADKITIKTETLDLGDIIIKYLDHVFVFERKTPIDLIASIRDGRYKEQKARLISNFPLHTISYIIEGDNVTASLSNTKNNTNTLLGAYYHTMFRDNIRILFTRNITETATFALTFAVKLLENPDKFKSMSKFESIDSYCDVIKMKKKKIDNIDPSVCYIMQLSQIPNISTKLAENIAKHYPTMIALLTTIQCVDNPDDKIKLLTKIDKIGKEKAYAILKYFHFVTE